MLKSAFFFSVLFIWTLSLPHGQDPIRIFNPQAGQTLLFKTTTPDGSYRDSLTIFVVRVEGDTGFVSSNLTTNESAMYTFEGVTTATMALRTGRLDTNGIYNNEMRFPENYSSASSQGERAYGFVRDYEIRGFHFDTLLVSCFYMSYLDAGDMCDFVTPSGIPVQSINSNCFCVNPGPFYTEPPDEVLQAAGGQALPVIFPGRDRFARQINGERFNVLGKVLLNTDYQYQISVGTGGIRLHYSYP